MMRPSSSAKAATAPPSLPMPPAPSTTKSSAVPPGAPNESTKAESTYESVLPRSRGVRHPSETQAFGEELGRSLAFGDVVILDGPLGAGKTTLTQGIARGMQVKGRVTSPTFVIAREHRSLVDGPALVHVDAYRLLGEGTGNTADPLGELDALDLDTDLDNAVVVAEW